MSNNNIPPPPGPGGSPEQPYQQASQYDQPAPQYDQQAQYYQQPQAYQEQGQAYQQPQQMQQASYAYGQQQQMPQQPPRPAVAETLRPAWTALVMIGFSVLGLIGSFLPYASVDSMGSLGFFSDTWEVGLPGTGTAITFIIFFLASGGFAAGWYFSKAKGLRLTAGILGIVLGVISFFMAWGLSAAVSLFSFGGVSVGIGVWLLILASVGIFVLGILMLAIKGSPSVPQPGGYPPTPPQAY